MAHMSYSPNSLKGVIWGIIYGTTIGVIKGDTRSLDCSSYIKAPERSLDHSSDEHGRALNPQT